MARNETASVAQMSKADRTRELNFYCKQEALRQAVIACGGQLDPDPIIVMADAFYEFLKG